MRSEVCCYVRLSHAQYHVRCEISEAYLTIFQDGIHDLLPNEGQIRPLFLWISATGSTLWSPRP